MITQILAKVLPVLVMIALGRVCATKGILNDDQHAGLKNIIGDILLPVVLFFIGYGAGSVLGGGAAQAWCSPDTARRWRRATACAGS